MKVDDRVNLAESTLDDEFWKIRNINENSVGTVVCVIGSNIVDVRWDNKMYSMSQSCVLKPFEDKNIPLPNRKFIELKQRKQDGNY